VGIKKAGSEYTYRSLSQEEGEEGGKRPKKGTKDPRWEKESSRIEVEVVKRRHKKRKRPFS